MTTTKRTNTTSTASRAVGRLIGLTLEVPPVAYAAITGELPGWARIWMGVWLSLWLAFTVVAAAVTQSRGEQ